MLHLIVLILECTEQCHDILQVWEQAGAPGATILESTGLARVQGKLRDDLPFMPSFRDLLKADEMHNRTMFAVVDDDETLERVLADTQRAIDFDQPNSGLLFVVPVSRVVGLKRHSSPKPE